MKKQGFTMVKTEDLSLAVIAHLKADFMPYQEPAVMCTLDHRKYPLVCEGVCWHCTHNADY
ncbi:hypothetical protein [Sporomusa malonica]|uniref:Uncharacterized protein n=1 Tax=Sporomusa malonica TaxID=112901 RepID=A0A1W2C5N3_9FIRM|nr:hypothetical protein [Sporomusa malonica]SMC80182.1 hypothetical protein SAMN04488500_109135 [Sporomusa malonica]